MDNLVYLSYGRSPHREELVFSVLSALHMMGWKSNNYRIIVYTDDPAAFGDLPIHIEPVNCKLLADWAGPSEYIHRRKVFAIRDALQKFGGRLAYCDTDTYFVKHPRKLFARIRPGHTVMHIREGLPDDLRLSELACFLESHDLRTIAGHRWNITRHTPIFNSGVIGLEEADISLLDEVVHLIDQIYPQLGYFATEQFALGACFSQYTTLHQAYDIVTHYWHPVGRALFREELSRVLHDRTIASYEERFRQLFPSRPSQRGLKVRIHAMLWKAAKRTGILNPLKKIATQAGLLHPKRYLQ
jgi:hypothetical protein